MFFSGRFWEKITGGQVQRGPCDDESTNPSLVFDGSAYSELVTLPLNLTNMR